MRSIIGNLQNNLQNKTKCFGFFTQTYKIKQNTDEAIPFARSQKSRHKYIVYLFQFI